MLQNNAVVSLCNMWFGGREGEGDVECNTKCGRQLV